MRPSRAGHRSLFIALACAALLLSHGARVSAQASDARSGHAFVVPPAPSKSPPRLALEVHSGFSVALDNDAVCPRGEGCVLRSGGGIGVSVERRWPKGLGVFGGYDAWFFDTDSVYELGVQQVLRGGVRYTMPTDIVFHPVFELGLGLGGYGDTFAIATVGGVGQAFAGGELELTETFGLRFGFGLRAFTSTKFRTERDKVERGDDGLFTQVAFIEIGLTVM